MGYGVTSIVYASRPTTTGAITAANQILLIFGKVLDESTGNLTGNEVLLWRGRTNTFTAGGNDPNAIEMTEWESGAWNATFEEGETALGTTLTPVDTSTASVSAHIVKNSVLTFEYVAPGGSSELYRAILTNYVYDATPMMREPGIAVDIVDYVPAEVGVSANQYDRSVQAYAEYDKVASYRRAVVHEYVHIDSFDVQLTGPKQFTATFSGTVYIVNSQDLAARVDLRLYAKELDGEIVAETGIYSLSPSYGTASGGAVPFSGSLVLTDQAGVIGYDLAKKYRFDADASLDNEIVYETETIERWTQRKLTSPVIDGMSALDGVGSVRWGAVENAAGYRIALVDSKYATPASSSSATSPWSFDESSSGTVVQGKYVRLQSTAVSTQYEYANSDWSEGVLIPDNRTPDDQEEEPTTPVEMIMTRRIYKAIPYIDVPVEQIGGGGSSAKDAITVEYADAHYAAIGEAITPSTLPIATDDELGAIKVGTHLSINDETGVLSVSDNGAIASGNTGLVTGGTVYAETNKYAAFANKTLETSVTQNNANAVTGGAVYTFVTTVSNLPKAKAAGGSSNAGVVYVTSASDKEGLIIDGTNDGQIKVDFATYSSWNSTVANKVVNPSYVKQAIEGYISAQAVSSSAGSSDASKLVKLNADGVIDGTMLKVVSVTNYFEAASQNAMLALSSAQDGDICVRTDEHKTYILMSDGAANGYATASNWKELTAPTGTVTSVNGKAGATVTLSLTDIYASGSTKASIDESISTDAISTENYHFPTSKAVQGYVTSKITALNLGGAATYSVATWTSGTTKWDTGGTGLVTATYLKNAIGDYGFGDAAKKGVATSVGSSDDLITASAVNTAISGLTYSDVGAAAASHTHSIGEITYTISSTNYTGEISASITSSSTHGEIPTAKAVYDYKPFVNRIIAGTSGTTTFSGVTTDLATTISSETYSIPTAYAVQQALNGKAASSHNQAITTIYATGTTAFAGIVTDYSTYTANAEDYKVPTAYAVKTALAGKANSTHTHTSAQISDAIDAVADPEASASFSKVVKTESTWGQISASLIPIDNDSITLISGTTLQVSSTWFQTTGDARYLKKTDAQTGYVKMANTSAGVWTPSTSYAVGDQVYMTDGMIWRCIQANTSTANNAPGGISNEDSGGNFVYWMPANIAVDTRFETTITGNGSTTEFTVTHKLGVKDVEVSLIDNSTDQEVFAAVTMYSTTQVKIGFGAAPASGKVYRVVVRR